MLVAVPHMAWVRRWAVQGLLGVQQPTGRRPGPGPLDRARPAGPASSRPAHACPLTPLARAPAGCCSMWNILDVVINHMGAFLCCLAQCSRLQRAALPEEGWSSLEAHATCHALLRAAAPPCAPPQATAQMCTRPHSARLERKNTTTAVMVRGGGGAACCGCAGCGLEEPAGLKAAANLKQLRWLGPWQPRSCHPGSPACNLYSVARLRRVLRDP